MPAAELRMGEMMASALPVPIAPFRTLQMISTHGAAHVTVHRRAAALETKMAAADVESGRHPTAVKSAAACVRIASRE